MQLVTTIHNCAPALQRQKKLCTVQIIVENKGEECWTDHLHGSLRDHFQVAADFLASRPAGRIEETPVPIRVLVSTDSKSDAANSSSYLPNQSSKCMEGFSPSAMNFAECRKIHTYKRSKLP